MSTFSVTKCDRLWVCSLFRLHQIPVCRKCFSASTHNRNMSGKSGIVIRSQPAKHNHRQPCNVSNRATERDQRGPQRDLHGSHHQTYRCERGSRSSNFRHCTCSYSIVDSHSHSSQHLDLREPIQLWEYLSHWKLRT